MSSLSAAKTHPTANRHRWMAAVAAMAVLSSTFAAPRAYAQGPNIPLIRDTEVEEIVHREGEPMWRAAGLNPDNVKVVIMGDPDPNAFTAGGTTIYVNTSLIEATKNPNQLIGVLAHETGHITGGHVARESMYKPALATYLLTMGLGILAAAAGAGSGAAGLIYSADYFATLTALTYSRVQEASADQAAATSLDKAHISSRGLVEFFDYYRYQEAFADAHKFRFFLDHPLSEERITALQQRAEKSPYYNEVDSPQALAEHAIMVAKLKAFMDLPQQTFITYKETDASFPARYARAFAMRARETLARDSSEYRRATDIILASQPSPEEMKAIARQGG